MKTIVVAALIWQEGRLLICQRRQDAAFPGKWEFPGGKMEPGEQPRAALCRELEEELGIFPDVEEELWRTEYQYPARPPVALFFFAVRRFEGVLQNRVFQQICWVRRQELPQYDFLEADLPLVALLAQGNLSL
jgi:8-oxo-dGTP diphosphatase